MMRERPTSSIKWLLRKDPQWSPLIEIKTICRWYLGYLTIPEFVLPAYALRRVILSPSLADGMFHMSSQGECDHDGSDTLSGTKESPFMPRLQRNPSSGHPLPHYLDDYRDDDGCECGGSRLRSRMWRETTTQHCLPEHDGRRRRQDVKHSTAYDGHAWRPCTIHKNEPTRLCSIGMDKRPGTIRDTGCQDNFLACAIQTEAGPWSVFFNELCLDNNHIIEGENLAEVLGNAGIKLTPTAVSDLMAPSSHSHETGPSETRDFLLLFPWRDLAKDIHRNLSGNDGGRRLTGLQVEKDDGRHKAGERPSTSERYKAVLTSTETSNRSSGPGVASENGAKEDTSHPYGDVQDEQRWFSSPTAKYLLAGGIAGMVSRTATAPFDRLKIFLITRPPELGGLPGSSSATPAQGVKVLAGAVARIYSEGGLRGFWVGNGLNLVKIFPESAVKFMSYEQSKLLFAKFWDHVEDPREISGSSRFISGGVGGITSQLFIYPIETLKTQMMSATSDQSRSLITTMRRLWVLGGVPAYYRGLTIGILGVFPYSAIDMSTFEAMKLAYLRSTKDEPGVLALLAFGSLSGSIGATSVFPLNLVRTRLQAAGSPGHPHKYTGVWDVITKTFERDGWRGFYRGLFPTLAKVIPSVSISYVVYEHTKRKLGV